MQLKLPQLTFVTGGALHVVVEGIRILGHSCNEPWWRRQPGLHRRCLSFQLRKPYRIETLETELAKLSKGNRSRVSLKTAAVGGTSRS